MFTQTADRVDRTDRTDRKPLSERKLAANRANAQKSTGPRTPGGKRTSSKNATTHGIFCHDLCLPGEDESIFHDFRHAILADLNPLTMTQLLLVDRIVSAQWRLRRLQTAEASLLLARSNQVLTHEQFQRSERQAWDEHWKLLQQQDPEGKLASGEPSDSDCPALTHPLPPAGVLASLLNASADTYAPLERLARHELRLEQTIHRCLRDLHRLQSGQNKPTDRTQLTPFLPPPHLPTPEHATEQNEPTAPTPAPDVPKCSTPIENVQNEPTESPKAAPSTQHSALRTQHSPSLNPEPRTLNPSLQNDPAAPHPHVITYSRNHVPQPPDFTQPVPPDPKV